MSAGEIFMAVILSYLVAENFLDFMIPGRWEERAYKSSMEEFWKKRKSPTKNREIGVG